MNTILRSTPAPFCEGKVPWGRGGRDTECEAGNNWNGGSVMQLREVVSLVSRQHCSNFEFPPPFVGVRLPKADIVPGGVGYVYALGTLSSSANWGLHF